MSPWRRRLPAFLLGLLLAGCAGYEGNAPLAHFDKDAGYRYQVVDQASPDNSDSLFVVVSFSGGGTRAAALAYGVLKQLRDTKIRWEGKDKRLLDEVDIISSVSGGSFTSAYYGLNRDAIFDGDYEQGYLKHDVERDLFWKLMNPASWFKLMSPGFGRSDLANQYYQQHLFGHKTFADLQRLGKPFLMINGTDMSTGGQFPFIQDQFDLLCSDLASYPLSRAVATSSAFPGLLTPLTYDNFAGGCGYQEPLWVANGAADGATNPGAVQFIDDRRSYYFQAPYNPPRPHPHLMDGGVADNLGLRSLVFGLENTGPGYSLLRRINQQKIKKLVFILVNAATDPENGLDQSKSVPGVFTTVLTSATVPLDNYTADTVARIKGALRTVDQDVKLVGQCNARLAASCLAASPLPAPYGLDSYISTVSFDAVTDPALRHWFKNLPTNFNLPPATVDKLIAAGQQLLEANPDYQALVRDIGASQGK
ncbi:patatin-like phospholipase family protein [Gallaecimonas kandeliae]|uniref:patatin-like phospholipase family protein n=1 Tax=Gallaecimonas kandeliae TaxID=3029055 RepID=UPI00264A3CA5|nr:patatin-like phospholipase family protein [Gallaecimonas kandeliae]WKE65861.1 patatin-like phospholipase family protein [Gallaecimonas kandeliae]